MTHLYLQLFGTPLPEHHKALDDAWACGHIFEQLSSQVNIRQFIHEEDYLPTGKKREYNAINTRHTQYGTATVAPDGLVFNFDKIPDKSFFKDRKVALSGMSGIDNNRIKSILTDSLGAKYTSNLLERQMCLLLTRTTSDQVKELMPSDSSRLLGC